MTIEIYRNNATYDSVRSKKILLIKTIRNVSGLGLRESKDLADSLEAGSDHVFVCGTFINDDNGYLTELSAVCSQIGLLLKVNTEGAEKYRNSLEDILILAKLSDDKFVESRVSDLYFNLFGEKPGLRE